MATFAWIYINRKTGPEQLFAKYYSADPSLITTMGGSDEYNFNKAMINYKTGKYKEAAYEWEALISLQAANDTLLYFTASAYLAQKKLKKPFPTSKKLLWIKTAHSTMMHAGTLVLRL